jgi:hypothetical protein
VTATAPGLLQLLIGPFVRNLAIDVFSATGQALLLDLLPERDTEAGRFLGVWPIDHDPANVRPCGYCAAAECRRLVGGPEGLSADIRRDRSTRSSRRRPGCHAGDYRALAQSISQTNELFYPSLQLKGTGNDLR